MNLAERYIAALETATKLEAQLAGIRQQATAYPETRLRSGELYMLRVHHGEVGQIRGALARTLEFARRGEVNLEVGGQSIHDAPA